MSAAQEATQGERAAQEIGEPVPGVAAPALRAITVERLRAEYADYASLAAGLNVPEGLIRNLKKEAVITPLIERGNHIVFHIPSVLAELKRFAGIKA